MDLYKHSPLEHPISIRLLTLLPGEYGTAVSCRITEYDRASILPYEALSCVWEDPESPQHILISESLTQAAKRFFVTRNIYDALQRLREVSTPRILWIDAVCIGQENTEEKGHQVAHMGKIYRQATCVIVWLGEDYGLSATKALLRGGRPIEVYIVLTLDRLP